MDWTITSTVRVSDPGFHLWINGQKTIFEEHPGSSRTIFRYGNFIIKKDEGSDQGSVEVLTFSKIDEADRKYFVPIVHAGFIEGGPAHNGFVVAQPFLTLTMQGIADEHVKEIMKIQKKYDLYDIDYPEDKCGIRNWALYKGEPVIYDYGMSSHIPSTQIRALYRQFKITA